MKKIATAAAAIAISVTAIYGLGYTKGSSICNAARIRDAANAEREAILFNAPLINLPYRQGLKVGLSAQCEAGWFEEIRTYSLKEAF